MKELLRKTVLYLIITSLLIMVFIDNEVFVFADKKLIYKKILKKVWKKKLHKVVKKKFKKLRAIPLPIIGIFPLPVSKSHGVAQHYIHHHHHHYNVFTPKVQCLGFTGDMKAMDQDMDWAGGDDCAQWYTKGNVGYGESAHMN